MAIFDRMKKRSTDSATAIPATIAIHEPESAPSVAGIATIAIATPQEVEIDYDALLGRNSNNSKNSNSNPPDLKNEVPPTPFPDDLTFPSEEQMERELMEMCDLPSIRGRSLLETGDSWCSELAEAIRFKIEDLLSRGPRPYAEIQSHTGASDDELRATIRDWPELCAGEIGGVWTWYLNLDDKKKTSANGPSCPETGSRRATPPEAPRTGQETAIPDPVSIAERIGIRFEQEIPIPEETKALGKPVFQYREHVLAWEADPPHIRLYAWATVNLFPGRALSVDINSMASLLRLSPREVRAALSELTKSKDLILMRERGRELYRLNVRYPEGGTNAKRD